jgi:hypothetical protein
VLVAWRGARAYKYAAAEDGIVSVGTQTSSADLEARIEHVTDELAALVIAGDCQAAARVLDGLRELAWHRRASEVRGRRHAGPRLRSLARRAGREGA